MTQLLWLAVAGAAGTLGRYGLSGLAYRIGGDRLPYGTLAVNVVGCLLIGAVMHVSLTTDALSAQLRLTLTVGFLGAFTTLSTFSYETLRYLEAGAWWPALANAGLNLALGLGATWLGLVAARLYLGGPS